jgi:hypothetical protein
MDHFGAFVPYLIFVTLTAIPAVTLLKRVGMSTAWAFFSLVPIGILIILWVVAYHRWPASEAGAPDA